MLISRFLQKQGNCLEVKHQKFLQQRATKHKPKQRYHNESNMSEVKWCTNDRDRSGQLFCNYSDRDNMLADKKAAPWKEGLFRSNKWSYSCFCASSLHLWPSLQLNGSVEQSISSWQIDSRKPIQETEHPPVTFTTIVEEHLMVIIRTPGNCLTF